jgi:hypothetical protein
LTDPSYTIGVRNMRFSGGIDPPYFKNVVPNAISVAADINAFPFDSGATYYVSGDVNVYLPTMVAKGYNAKIITGPAGKAKINPKATDLLRKKNGDLALGVSYYITDVNSEAYLNCYEPNVIREMNSVD